MEDNSLVNETELEKVAGGAHRFNPRGKFQVGDRVIHTVFREFGVGVVIGLYYENQSWKYQVDYGTKTIQAYECDLFPA